MPVWARKEELVPKEEQLLRQFPWPAEPEVLPGVNSLWQPLGFPLGGLRVSWIYGAYLCPSRQDEGRNGRVVWGMRLSPAWGAPVWAPGVSHKFGHCHWVLNEKVWFNVQGFIPVKSGFEQSH